MYKSLQNIQKTTHTTTLENVIIINVAMLCIHKVMFYVTLKCAIIKYCLL